MAKSVIVLGGGGHAKVLIEALQLSDVNILGITDPQLKAGDLGCASLPILGDDQSVFQYPPTEIELVNGVGSLPGGDARARLFDTYKGKGYCFATVVHPSAIISKSSVILEGGQVMARGVVQPGATIGRNTIINTGTIVEHDCEIGAHNHLAPGVVLSGGVHTGENVHIGTGAVVIQNINIGDDTVVGAGATVTRDIGPNQIIYPARPKVSDR